MLSISKPVSEKEEAAEEGEKEEKGEGRLPLCPGAIMGMHFLAITAGGFGWVRVGSEQEEGKNRGRRWRGRILLIGCACLAHLLCAVCAPARG